MWWCGVAVSSLSLIGSPVSIATSALRAPSSSKNISSKSVEGFLLFLTVERRRVGTGLITRSDPIDPSCCQTQLIVTQSFFFFKAKSLKTKEPQICVTSRDTALPVCKSVAEWTYNFETNSFLIIFFRTYYYEHFCNRFGANRLRSSDFTIGQKATRSAASF